MGLKITEMIKNAKPGEVITIAYPCGSGKTRGVIKFAKSKEGLKGSKKRILFLSPRKTLRFQNKDTFKDNANVTSMTIQTLNFIENRECLYECYDYIFVDEAQCIILDAAFNQDMVLIMEDLFTHYVFENRGVLVAMTGTDIGMQNYFKMAHGAESQVFYEKDKIDFLKGDVFAFIHNGYSVVQIIREKLEKGEKVIYFSETIKEIDMLLDEFPSETMAIISENAEDYERICGGKEREKDKADFLKDKKLPDKYNLLVATKALDVGVSIEDPKVTTIICAGLELATMRQMIARRRIKGNEKIDLYIVLPETKSLAQRKRRAEERYKSYKLYMENPEEYAKTMAGKRLKQGELIFPIGSSEDGTPQYAVDWPAVAYTEYMLATTLKTPKVYAYQRCVSDMLGCEGVVLPDRGQEALEALVGVKLTNKEEKMMLISALGNLFKSPKCINRLLEEWGLPYRIKDRQYANLGTDKNGTIRQTNRAWMLVRI